MNPDTRFSLISRICDSANEDAWSEFIEIYQPVVFRFAQKFGLQHADAAEISQEVMSSVANSVEHWDCNQKNSTFRGWLYRITRNKTVDFLRKRKLDVARHVDLESKLNQIAAPSSNNSDEFQIEFEKQLFIWAAKKLKPSYKPNNWQAFWLSTVEGVPIEEVAKRLEIEPSTIYVARSRIISRLSQLIRERMKETNI